MSSTEKIEMIVKVKESVMVGLGLFWFIRVFWGGWGVGFLVFFFNSFLSFFTFYITQTSSSQTAEASFKLRYKTAVKYFSLFFFKKNTNSWIFGQLLLSFVETTQQPRIALLKPQLRSRKNLPSSQQLDLLRLLFLYMNIFHR